jgi:hypothetical protein
VSYYSILGTSDHLSVFERFFIVLAVLPLQSAGLHQLTLVDQLVLGLTEVTRVAPSQALASLVVVDVEWHTVYGARSSAGQSTPLCCFSRCWAVH